MTAIELTNKQKTYLRGLGQALNATLNVGKEGAAEGIRQALEALLVRHELVKGRVQKSAEGEPRDLAASLAEATGAALVGVVGRTFLVYRPNPERKERIVLPDLAPGRKSPGRKQRPVKED